ncbi:sigma-w pathway protein ysdB [Alkalicoccus halolimnae]|jgi:hypothetical protein|uniref:Sigma-w pathway protein ysdB n=1 Tax=Alkalicoccus halolimnae TaxID=1667239 RepID=A0A5C7F589_9BACI|nr:sigma-w pathway protein ysdB [Alkalicoccus halolimnae]TXF85762.1 sigma-w pathway protein ysdB [Alkalicoccus halolimnae]
MFTVLLFRLFLLIAVSIIIYSLIKYFTDPRRRLERAQRSEDFYILDDTDNVRKNIFLTVRGAMFEGEKFLGTTDQSVEVTTIILSTDDQDRLRGMTSRDFHAIEKELIVRYPKADIEWRQPIADIKKKLEQQRK